MKHSKKIIKIDGQEFLVTFKKMKSIRLKFDSKSGLFSVSAPYFLTIKQVSEFVLSKMDWVQKQTEKYNNRPPKIGQVLKTGEEIWFKGEKWTLKIEEVHSKFRFEIVETRTVVLYVPFSASQQIIQQVLDHAYKVSIKQILPEIIEKWENIVGVQSNGLLVRKMKTRWGTCNINSKRITINTELMKQPIINIEHVVLHELVHLLERGHNKRFYGFLDQFQPGWRLIDADIKRRGLEC